MSWTMNPRALPNGTVLFLGISYASSRTADTRGRTQPKVYTYVALKQAGVWYFSGSGRVPQAAGWGAVEKWLERDGRKLEWVKIVSELKDVYLAPIPASPVATWVNESEEFPIEPGTEWADDRTYGTGPSPTQGDDLLDSLTELEPVCSLPACGCSGAAHP